MFDSSLGAAVQPALAGTATADTLDINAEQMAQLPGIYKLSDGSIPPQDSIRLASNERAGRGSAN
jgi:hypothetical protein